jgi:hypothetical protein
MRLHNVEFDYDDELPFLGGILQVQSMMDMKVGMKNLP